MLLVGRKRENHCPCGAFLQDTWVGPALESVWDVMLSGAQRVRISRRETSHASEAEKEGLRVRTVAARGATWCHLVHLGQLG